MRMVFFYNGGTREGAPSKPKDIQRADYKHRRFNLWNQCREGVAEQGAGGMSIEKPNKMPKLKGKAFLKPSRLALDMDIILFGPGVNAVMNTYDKKPVQLNILRSYAVKM